MCSGTWNASSPAPASTFPRTVQPFHLSLNSYPTSLSHTYRIQPFPTLRLLFFVQTDKHLEMISLQRPFSFHIITVSEKEPEPEPESSRRSLQHCQSSLLLLSRLVLDRISRGRFITSDPTQQGQGGQTCQPTGEATTVQYHR